MRARCRTGTRFIGLGIAVVILTLAAACSASPPEPRSIPVGGSEPRSVVAGYFDAWAHQDWSRQTELVDTELVQVLPEPLTKVELLAVFAVEIEPPYAMCEAIFEAGSPGEGATVERGRHTWNFDLFFNDDRGTYVITDIQRD